MMLNSVVVFLRKSAPFNHMKNTSSKTIEGSVAVWPSGLGARLESSIPALMDLFQIVPGTTLRLRLRVANWPASSQLKFLTC